MCSRIGEVYAVSWSDPVHLYHMLIVSFTQFDLHDVVQDLDFNVSCYVHFSF
jgi:hypothetical protein